MNSSPQPQGITQDTTCGCAPDCSRPCMLGIVAGQCLAAICSGPCQQVYQYMVAIHSALSHAVAGRLLARCGFADSTCRRTVLRRTASCSADQPVMPGSSP